jgi:heme/copper-type cytochrome/quinol oxidase subunit 2
MKGSRNSKAWAVRGILAIAFCLACATPVAAQEGTPPTPPPGAPPASPPAAAPAAPAEEAPPAPPQEIRAKRLVRTFKIFVDNRSWTPDTIRVKKGDHVVLKLHAYQASRSFVLKGYKIDKPLPQDEDVTVEFDADKTGEFPWKCGRPCGNNCAKLRGTLFVD